MKKESNGKIQTNIFYNFFSWFLIEMKIVSLCKHHYLYQAVRTASWPAIAKCNSAIFSGRHSQLCHVPCLDARRLPCFTLADWVQRCCTELFHASSLDYFLRMYYAYNRKTHLYHCPKQLCIQGHGSENLSTNVIEVKLYTIVVLTDKAAQFYRVGYTGTPWRQLTAAINNWK